VLNRANARMNIFRGDTDYEAFERALSETFSLEFAGEGFRQAVIAKGWVV
jgi:hypothetical protein